MIINEISRPFQPKKRYGTRLRRNPFYQSTTWKKVIRPEFLSGHTPWQQHRVPNTLCIQCYKRGTMTPTHTVDHIIAIDDGGSSTDIDNMQGLCLSCHNRKSAREGNARRNK